MLHETRLQVLELEDIFTVFHIWTAEKDEVVVDFHCFINIGILAMALSSFI